MTVLPTQVAPAPSRAKTVGAVEVATGCVLAQSGFPKPVTYPSTSNLFHTNTSFKFNLQKHYQSLADLGVSKSGIFTTEMLWLERKNTYISLIAKVSELRGTSGAEFGGKVNFSMNAP